MGWLTRARTWGSTVGSQGGTWAGRIVRDKEAGPRAGLAGANGRRAFPATVGRPGPAAPARRGEFAGAPAPVSAPGPGHRRSQTQSSPRPGGRRAAAGGLVPERTGLGGGSLSRAGPGLPQQLTLRSWPPTACCQPQWPPQLLLDQVGACRPAGTGGSPAECHCPPSRREHTRLALGAPRGPRCHQGVTRDRLEHKG